MAESYQRFLDYDWSDERWRAYLDGLYPAPKPQQQLRFKKKWYKKNVDPEFDDGYEPPAPPPPPAASPACPPTSGARSAPVVPQAAFADGTKWQVMGRKGTICFSAYAVSMVIALGGVAGVLPAYQGMLLLIWSFVLDILAKYGFRLRAEYLHFVLLDDVGVMPILAVTLLTPGLHPGIRRVALTTPLLSALLSFSQICKNHGALPATVRDFFSPLAEPVARYKVMRLRGYAEVGLGFLLALGVLTARAAPFSALIYWNVMMMRYMMSHWTQQAFTELDSVLEPACEKVPGLKQGYSALKAKLYGFVDPQSKSAGRLCAIL